MNTTGTESEDRQKERGLYMAIELGGSRWQLGFTDTRVGKMRRRTIAAADAQALVSEVLKAKLKFGLSPEARVVSCYEAGRDSFWLHRFLVREGVENRVVDSSSIEVNRRARRAKTDRLDVEKLVRMLVRYDEGEERIWKVVRVPSVEQEDSRRLHRERERLGKERVQLQNRIRGLLAGQGVKLGSLRELPARLETLRLWNGQPLPPALREEVERCWARLELIEEQKRSLEREQRKEVRVGASKESRQVGQLAKLRGVGIQGSWVLVHEFFSWRQFRNRREVGALAGLTGTPYCSDGSSREQGISKAGNRRVRCLMVELGWLWLRHQPESALSQWFNERFAKGGSRSRRLGIVALARKLLIAFWRYVDQGVLPRGAQLKAAA